MCVSQIATFCCQNISTKKVMRLHHFVTRGQGVLIILLLIPFTLRSYPSLPLFTFLIFPASHPSNKMLFYRGSLFVYSCAVSCLPWLAVYKHLSRFFFFGQERNLANRPYETTNALEEHGEIAVSSVLYLILECLGNR